MHPILVKRQRLGLYLLAWAPMVALLAALLVLSGGSPLVEALVLALPLTLVYAFVCLAAWYPCRAMPLEAAGLSRAIAAQVATGLSSSVMWVALAWGVGHLLERTGQLPGVSERVTDQAALLLAFGFLAYLLSVAVHYLLAAFETSREAERRALQAAVAAKEAELQMLRTQVDPHFLFNSLNSVSSLTASDPEAARQMCIQLGDFLRGSLQTSKRPTILLADELELVQRFLAIEKVRFGSRLAVDVEVADGCEDWLVPSMILQPLAENGIKHGISRLVDGGRLQIRIWRNGSRLHLSVSNPVDPEAPPSSGRGVGLSNLRQRLNNLYSKNANLLIQEQAGRFTVEAVLPVLPHRQQEG